jgi:hypothetical protein
MFSTSREEFLAVQLFLLTGQSTLLPKKGGMALVWIKETKDEEVFNPSVFKRLQCVLSHLPF